MLKSWFRSNAKLIIQISVVCSLLMSQFVGASSIYDNNYQFTNSLSLRSYGYGIDCAEENITASWIDVIRDSDTWPGTLNSIQRSAAIASFEEALSNGHWGVSQFANGNGSTIVDKEVEVFWSEGQTSEVKFLNDGQVIFDSDGVNDVHQAMITFSQWGRGFGGCEPVIYAYSRGHNPGSHAPISNSWGEYNSGFTNYFVNAPVVYPPDYEGEYVRKSLNYVALGDSFSSGEGNPPFETGTEDTCHRSSFAYPRLLESSKYLRLTEFAACSGAISSDIDGTGQNDQISALSQNTDIVTLTVGGNDAGFKDFATACTLSLCDFTTQIYDDTHDKITNDLPSKLADVYEAIDQETSNDAHIYVLGYPNILPAQMPTGPNSMCWPFNGGVNDPDPAQNNGAAAFAIQTLLNDTIEQAVGDFGSSKFQYINPNDNDSPFNGHDWCTQDRYFNQITFNQLSYSYHPNISGHAAYADIVNGKMD